ncbi:phosphotriesterase family protein [Limisphaera sp. 4302-co]|uniref:phosphotriesterase family protein n=1 Tax=Limisphaera sp. 4302-co TaxID=3400417 RepID=UPI003C2651A5
MMREFRPDSVERARGEVRGVGVQRAWPQPLRAPDRLNCCSRRAFLGWTLLAAAGCARFPGVGPRTDSGWATGPVIVTVRGPVPAVELGRALTHEHVVTDFIGAEQAPGPRYEAGTAIRVVLPHLQALRARGVDALFECTPRYIGRHVLLLRRLSELSGLHVVTNTGYYGAAGNRYLPRHAHQESEEQLARRWIAEWEGGIEGTGIRPGFIKLGTDRGPLPPLHVKLLRAAARVHLETGLTICGHSGDGVAALDQLRILESEGVSPEAFVWVHAQNGTDAERIEAARRGAWISLDGYSVAPEQPERYRDALLALKAAGVWHRVLVSHDDGWAVEGEALHGASLRLFNNGNPRPYASVFERLWPDLLASGCSGADLERLLRDHPAAAFAVRVRRV